MFAILDFSALAERHNPIVRRVVRRTRPMLEERGLLKPVGVIAHPRAGDGLPISLFDGERVSCNELVFNAAYEAAEAFSRLYAARRPGAGFRDDFASAHRVSLVRAGRSYDAPPLGDLSEASLLRRRLVTKDCRQTILRLIHKRSSFFERLSETSAQWLVHGYRSEVQVILHIGERTCWNAMAPSSSASTERPQNGCSKLFAQLTRMSRLPFTLADQLHLFNAEPTADRPRGNKSRHRSTRGGTFHWFTRCDLRASTFSGSEPKSTLTCLGIRHASYSARAGSDGFGQSCDNVHILNLRYARTVEDQVYANFSDCFGDIFSVLGQLPDGFEDQWIEAVLQDRQAVKNFSQRVEKGKPSDGSCGDA